MFGNLWNDDVAKFWRHIRTLKPWQGHPHLQDPHQDFSKLVGFQLHADGAEMFRDDECFCYSWSSIFASCGNISDVMLYRFPILLIQERHMQSPKVPQLGWNLFFFFSFKNNWFPTLSTPILPRSWIHEVKRHVNEVLAKVCAWSLKISAEGVGPKVGFYGEAFAPNSFRAGLIGEPLAKGFKSLGLT